MGKVIGFTFDLKSDAPLKAGDPVDANAEFDAPETVDAVRKAIESGGHTVVPIGNVRQLLARLPGLEVDAVFNICEGLCSRNREAQVPVILELFGVPYIGSDGLTMSLTLDKIMTKRVLMAEGIPTPRFIGINCLDDLIGLDHMRFPMIVKLRQEGSSKGLDDASVVHNRKELEKRAELLFERYKQSPLIIEEFIAGKEFTVPIIGNASALPLPAVQVEICNKLDLGEMIYTYERIFTSDLRYICPAQIEERFEKVLIDLAWRTYKAVGCLDFGRIDFRVDKDNNPYVLEINPLPSLSTEDVFELSPKAAGYGFNEIICKIIDVGLERLGIAVDTAASRCAI